ncbi:hypothetical protein DP117_14225 [Brasilonema sp. UFV-L1]|nr:hypothetical protein [Brasilonema sp. UFV-L1]
MRVVNKPESSKANRSHPTNPRRPAKVNVISVITPVNAWRFKLLLLAVKKMKFIVFKSVLQAKGAEITCRGKHYLAIRMIEEIMSNIVFTKI